MKTKDLNKEGQKYLQDLWSRSKYFIMVNHVLMEENSDYLENITNEKVKIKEMNRIRNEFHKWLESLSEDLRIIENEKIKNKYYESRRKNN